MRIPAAETPVAAKASQETEDKSGAEKTKKKKQAKTEEKDSKVELSAESRKLSEHKANATPEKEIKEAETLMDRVESGKMSQNEHDLAMKRVGEIVKKYGEAAIKGPDKSKEKEPTPPEASA